MKRFLKSGLVVLFALLLLFGGITVFTIVRSQSFGRLINYVGIVRGATQRLVKLELQDQPNDALVEYLDGILQELDSGKGEYGLPSPDDEAYQQNLGKLNQMWGELKENIADYRAGREDGAELLDLSEDYFNQANDTVFAADAYSFNQTRILLVVCVVMLCIMLLTWAFIFWAYSKNLLRLQDSNKKLSDLTRRDALTGAYQIEAFKEEAQQLIDAAPEKKFALIYTDFADFKYINDVFGYEYGDSILAKYGEIISASLRDGELYGRVTADNFVLLRQYQEKGEVAARQRIADQEILEYMNNSCNWKSLSTFCGICCVEDVVENLKIDGFLDRANFARKTVKNGTNPNYTYYDEGIRYRLREEKEVENQIQEALGRREFIVYYQPKVDLKTGKIASAEALVRWRAEDGTVVTPGRFIEILERTFKIDQLDRYVFEEVCRWLRHLLDQGKRALPVSVNVSRLQFYDQDFTSRYIEIRDKYRIPPELLEIEFTESVVFDNTNLLIQVVNSLKQAGFSCSIDDFGKGYSSLALLKNLPVDVLKIDRFFFAEEDDQERALAVVQGIVELVRRFNIRTVAEGIESMEQVEYLKQIGCDYVQGYVFYRPMPQEEYEKRLDEGE